MDRQNKIDGFVLALEGLSSSLITESFKLSNDHLESLENNIINYIKANYPSIIVTQDELKRIIEPVYQDRHLNLKKSIDKNIGLMKYNLEEENADVDKIIREEIAKYKTLFTSIHSGTNISYLGLVDKCTENVMGMLIRKNNSISFAKKTEDVRKYIYELVNSNFFKIMISLGDYFIDNGIIPIEQDFKTEELGKSKIKTEEFF